MSGSGRVRANARRWLPWLVLIVLAAGLRVILWPHQTYDTIWFLVPWCEQLRREGGLAAIGTPISNYTPPYLYLLALIGYLPVKALVAVKLLSTLIDLLLVAVVAGLAVQLRPGRHTAWIAAAAVALLPSVVIDSALLGQCDALYAGLLLLALLLVFRDRPYLAGLVLGVALAVKLQAVFVLPVFVLLLIRRRIPISTVPMVALGWVAAMLPAVLAGRPVLDLPQIYLTQIRTFGDLTLHAPNLYQWLPENPALTWPGIAVSALLVTAVLAWVIASGTAMDDALVVRVGFLILLLVPFTLPRMHERYTYPADALGVVYAFAVHRGWFAAAGGAIVSAFSYLPFGIGLVMPMPALALAEAGVILLVALELVRHVSDLPARPAHDGDRRLGGRSDRPPDRRPPERRAGEPLPGMVRICG